MKFTFLRKLRNQDSAAGAAPAAPAAPAPSEGGTPAAVAVQGQEVVPSGQESAPSPAPDASAAPDYNDAPAFDAWWSTATEAQRDAWMLRMDEDPGQATTEGEGESKEEQASEEKPVAETAVDLGEGLSQDEIAKLPPRAQEAIKQAQAFADSVAPYEKFLNPQFQESLVSLLTHPVVAQVARELEAGNVDSPAWLQKELTPSMILDEVLEAKGIDTDKLGFDLDEGGAKGELVKLATVIAERAVRAAGVKHKIEMRQQGELSERAQFIDMQFANLTQKVASLKSDKPIDSPDHPINGFRTALLKDIAEGKISYDFVKEMGGDALFAAYEAKKAGGVQNLVNKPVEGMRRRWIAQHTDVARAAVTAGAARQPQALVTESRHGVDLGKYGKDPVYTQNMDALAMKNAEERGDETLMRYLETLNIE